MQIVIAQAATMLEEFIVFRKETNVNLKLGIIAIIC